jgi:hypothetical protein
MIKLNYFQKMNNALILCKQKVILRTPSWKWSWITFRKLVVSYPFFNTENNLQTFWREDAALFACSYISNRKPLFAPFFETRDSRVLISVIDKQLIFGWWVLPTETNNVRNLFLRFDPSITAVAWAPVEKLCQSPTHHNPFSWGGPSFSQYCCFEILRPIFGLTCV